MTPTQIHRSLSCPDACHRMDFEIARGVAARAIQDARQGNDPVLQQAALAWLWVCCPDLADELALPIPASMTVHIQAASYCDRLGVLD